VGAAIVPKDLTSAWTGYVVHAISKEKGLITIKYFNTSNALIYDIYSLETCDNAKNKYKLVIK
jgi:hypothetical protein